jgi:hypothetical protein
MISTHHCANRAMGMFEKTPTQSVTLTKTFDIIGGN